MICCCSYCIADDATAESKKGAAKRQDDTKDAAEVRRYMLQRRQELRLREKEDREEKMKCAARLKEKLNDLYSKQQEIAAASAAVSREKQTARNRVGLFLHVDIMIYIKGNEISCLWQFDI